MNKRFIGVLCGALISLVAMSQKAETSSRSGSVVKPISKTENPATDKIDQFEIQSVGGTTFSTANNYDGSSGSYQHSLRINVTLLPVKAGNSSFQLVFYSDAREYPQAASFSDGMLNIYYPISLYDGIREKLEQAVANRKKIVVRVVQKTDGYREGSLIF